MDRYDAVLLITVVLQLFSVATGDRVIPEPVRVVFLLMSAWPVGVWWLRQVDASYPLWSFFCVTGAFGLPILYLIRLRFLWGQG